MVAETRETQSSIYIPSIVLGNGQKGYLQSFYRELAQMPSVKGEKRVLLFLGSRNCLDRIISYDEMEGYLGYSSKSIEKRINSRRELKSRFNKYMVDTNIRLYSVFGRGFVVLPDLPKTRIFVNPNLEVEVPKELESEGWSKAYRRLKQTFLISELSSHTLRGAVKSEAQSLLDLMLKNPNKYLTTEDIIAHKYGNSDFLGDKKAVCDLAHADKSNLVRNAAKVGIHIGIETHIGLGYELTDMRIIDHTA